MGDGLTITNTLFRVAIYEQPQTCPKGLIDVSLPLGPISGLHLLLGALHGAYCLSCDFSCFTGLAKYALEKQTNQLRMAGIGTVHECMVISWSNKME